MGLNKLVDSRDVRFVLFEILHVDELGKQISQYADFDRETYEEVLNLAERVAVEKLYPANTLGDKEGCTFDPATKKVKIPISYKVPLDAYYEAGFYGISDDPEIGGMGMPGGINAGCSEMLLAANIPLIMYPGLSHGAMNLIKDHGSDELKKLYIDKMMSGEWGGTMCLTEPDAGTDVGLLKSKAVKQADGTYKITGQNIFISSGDNDYYKNMIHLKLARVEGDPAGTKGLSIFVVPKYWVNPDGSMGGSNDVACVGIEHKMGIKGSATCTLSFGDNGKCRGFILGEERQGMKIMFQMMNEERVGVGMQGLALSSTAYMHAVTYTRNRVQGQHPTQSLNPDAPAVKIIEHPDVKRMLIWMKSHVEGMRVLGYLLAHLFTLELLAGGEVAEEARCLGDFLRPIHKAGNTDTGVLVASEAIQCLGGYGYCSDYLVEQFMRDSKIFTLFEGTNGGAQARDFTFRKLLMDKDQKNYKYFKKRVADTVSGAKGIVDDRYIALVEKGIQKFDEAVNLMLKQAGEGKFLLLFAQATPLAQAMHMLVLAWAHLWSLTIATPEMKESTGDSKGADREKIMNDNSEAAYYAGRVLSGQFYLGSEFPKYFGRMESIMINEAAAIKASSPIFTGMPLE